MTALVIETRAYSVECDVCLWSAPHVELSPEFAQAIADAHNTGVHQHDPDAEHDAWRDPEDDGIPLGFGEPEDG